MLWNGGVFLMCERGQSMFSSGINNKEKIFYDYVVCPLKVLRSHNFQGMSSKWTYHHGDPKVIPTKLSKYMPSLWCILGLPCQGGTRSVFLFISSHLRGVDRSQMQNLTNVFRQLGSPTMRITSSDGPTIWGFLAYSSDVVMCYLLVARYPGGYRSINFMDQRETEI